MTIKFYDVTDDRRRVKKTLKDSGAGANLKATLTGNIKDDCSITDPIIEVSYSADILASNYMYIQAFSRYYFITNITTSAQRLIISAHVDVLMSYLNDIKKLRCVVERQADPEKCNQYQADNAYRSEARFNIRIKNFPRGFDKSTASYVLTTGGKS